VRACARASAPQHSGCEALLRDNKTDDLARMYRLFARVLTGLQPIGAIVRKHIADVGMALVRKQEGAIGGGGGAGGGADGADGDDASPAAAKLSAAAAAAAAGAADMNPYIQVRPGAESGRGKGRVRVESGRPPRPPRMDRRARRAAHAPCRLARTVSRVSQSVSQSVGLSVGKSLASVPESLLRRAGAHPPWPVRI
jgi:hypothetical protein